MKEKDKTQTLESDLDEPLNKRKEKMESINEVQEEEESSSTSINIASSDEGELTKKKEKEVLVKFLDDLKTKLNSKENEEKTFDEIYEDYLDSEFITKSHIKEKIDKYCLKFMIFFFGPFFGITFLIGIFQIKSIMNALLNLITESCIKYYYCTFNSNCTVNYSVKELNVFNFYNYYYNYTMNESIDVNLMLMTGIIGNLFLSWIGFKLSIVLIFGPINIGAIFWLLNFEFSIGNEFDYDWVKILNLIVIYIIFYIGLGSSSLLSQQILIESYFKYKNYLIEKKKDQLKHIDEQRNKNKIEMKSIKGIFSQNKLDIEPKKEVSAQVIVKEENTLDIKLSLKNRSNSFPSLKNFEKKYNRLTKEIYKIEKNKFDFFIMICLTTTLGFLGKLLMNIILDSILFHIYGDNYDKRIFLIAIMILYGFCMVLSVILCFIYEKSTFEIDDKMEEKKIDIKICQICGFILYCETQKLEEPEKKGCCSSNNSRKSEVPIINNYQPNPKEKKCCCYSCCEYTKGCCILCGESIQNCCYATFGYLLSILLSICYRCNSQSMHICESCKSNDNDYTKNKECFCYCYKARRKSLWCNKFFTNKTVKNIFPFMIVYFILQLITIGFEKQYEKYKYLKFHIKTFIFVWVGTFFLFFYLTLSFSRLFRKEKDEHNSISNNEINSNDDSNSSLIKKKSGDVILYINDILSELSNDILNGTIGILFFNGVFSFVFSLFYFVNISEEYKSLFFKDNINIIIIPILLNNFYYLTLNYYCTYTAEKTKRFEILSCSSLIAFYILIWRLVIILIKTFIPEDNDNNTYINFQILYIIQLVISGIITLFVAYFVFSGIIMSMGFIQECSFCFFKKGESNCTDFHLCLFFLCSFIFFCGGLWLQMKDLSHYYYECYCDEYCTIERNCCNIDCLVGVYDGINCDCCFCECCDKILIK